MKARVLIFDLDRGTEEAPGKRGPAWHLNGSGKRVFDNPIAIIWDPGDLGVGDWVNTPGNVFFTLPLNHPQIDLIEPLQVHYRVEIKRNGVWEAFDDNTDGLITKVDATENEAVFYGTNYVGLLDRTFEQRFKAKLGPDVPVGKGGSKYVKKTIEFVIKDQLAVEAKITSSPLGFITAPTLPGWPEKITIYSIFKQRLQFIAGLMDSHIADTNRRPRLKVIRNSNHAGYDPTADDEQYTWVFGDVPGTKRNDLKLEYGALVNGFRVIPIDDNWATKGLGVGRTITGTLPLYATATPKMEGGGDFPEWNWGSFPRVSFFDELIDPADLKRRTARLARRAGQFGQAVGLALAVNGVEPVREWDLLDQFPIVIDRGVIHSELYNDGYWTAVGYSWRLSRDGHEELVITFEPHDALSTSITADLIPSDPAVQPGPVRVGCGEPEVNDTWTERIYYDRCSGLTYVLEDCPDVGYVDIDLTENFGRVIQPWAANEAQFFTHNTVRYWSAASGPLASTMEMDGTYAKVVATSLATDSSRYAEASIPVLSDVLATPVELLVTWKANCPDVPSSGNSARKASVVITIAGISFDMDVQSRTFGGSTVFDNGDTLEALQVNLRINGTTAVYSGTGATDPLGTGEGFFYPYHDPEDVIMARLRVEQSGNDVFVKGNIWFDTDGEPAGWLYEATHIGTAIDLTASALTMRIRPYRNPISGPEAGVPRTTYVDSLELVSGEGRDYIGLDGVLDLGSFDFPYNGVLMSPWTMSPESGIMMSARTLKFTGYNTDTPPKLTAFEVSDWDSNSAFSSHTSPVYRDALGSPFNTPPVDPGGRGQVRVTEFTLPDDNNVLHLQVTVRGKNNETSPVPFKVVLLDPVLDFDAIVALGDMEQADFPDMTAGTIISEGTVPASFAFGTIGTIDQQFLAKGIVQLAVIFEDGLAVEVELAGSLDAVEGNTDYCWDVKPPVPWKDGDPTQPFPAAGQIVPRHKVATGNAVAQYFYTTIRGLYLPFDPDAVAIPYQPGSLRVDVDGLYCNLAETDPTTGLFFLPFVPETDEDVFAEWRRHE